MAVKEKKIWGCNECGHTQVKWTGVCPSCKQWNTFVEEVSVTDKNERFAKRAGEKRAKPVAIRDVGTVNFERLKTGLEEFDRLLGGGIVRGSLTLLGGDPGIGKSTMLLQVADALARQGLNVLYVSGEESAEQAALRAKRIGVESERLYLLSDTLFSHVKAQIEELRPDVLIVDSIQILYKSELPSAPGSVSQVRELAMEFMHIAKGMNIATFLIGHVTKAGEIAGPRVLEHIVDTVLDFDGGNEQGYRMLRLVKNRFGSTDEIALFQMGAKGLIEVKNPSEIFLQERTKVTTGSAIIPTVEGSRAILVEVQALVTASSFSTSSRKSAGLDQNRLALLLAVLEKRVGYSLHSCDVFVSLAGGMKIVEPAIDLGILLAIASSFSNRPIPPDTLIVGEVGLSGEIRPVSRIENRLKEAIQLGFSQCILPERNLKSLPKQIREKITLNGVELVEEAVNVVVH